MTHHLSSVQAKTVCLQIIFIFLLTAPCAIRSFAQGWQQTYPAAGDGTIRFIGENMDNYLVVLADGLSNPNVLIDKTTGNEISTFYAPDFCDMAPFSGDIRISRTEFFDHDLNSNGELKLRRVKLVDGNCSIIDQVLFDKTYDLPSVEKVRLSSAIYNTSQNTVFLSGVLQLTPISGSTDYQFFIKKIDGNDGSEMWQFISDVYTFVGHPFGLRLQTTTVEGGVVGTTGGGGVAPVRLFKVAGNGQLDHEVEVGGYLSSVLDVVEGANSALFVRRYSASYSGPGDSYRISKLDADGNVRYNQSAGAILSDLLGGFQFLVRFDSQLPMANGDVVLTGRLPDQYFFLTRLDVEGEVRWIEVYQGLDPELTDAIFTSDGGFLFGGRLADELFLIKTDSEGKLSAPCTNLIVNSSFEDGLQGWTIEGEVALTNDANTGAQAAEICGPPGSIGQIAVATPGEVYTGSIWGKYSGNPSYFTAQLRFLDSNYAPLPGAPVAFGFNSNTVYVNQSFSGTAPLDAAFVHLYVFKENGGCVLVDDFEICEETVALPDLTINNLVLNGLTVKQGEFIQNQFTIKNSGAAASGTYQLSAYASPTPNIGASSTFLGQVDKPSLPVGGVSSGGIGIQLPIDFPLGNYYFIVVVDEPNTVTETNEDNNVLASIQTFEVTPAGGAPELTITNVNCPGDFPSATESITWDITVQNNGGSTSASTPIYLYNTAPGVVAYVTLELGTATVPALSPGSSTTFSITVPSNVHTPNPGFGAFGQNFLLSGVKGLSFTPLSTNSGFAPEYSEGDGFPSIYCKKFSTDLAVDLSSAQVSVAPDEPYTYTVQVTNNGPEDAYNMISNLYTTNSSFPQVPVFSAQPSEGEIWEFIQGAGAGTTNTSRQWYLPFLAVGESATVAVTLSPVPNFPWPASGATFGKTVNSFHNEDPSPANNSDAVSFTITNNPGGEIDLELTLDQGNATPAQWSNYSVLGTLKNTGSETATGVEVSFNKPDGVVYVGGNEFDASQGSFDPNGNQTWGVGDIPAGGMATLEVNYFLLEPTAPVAYAQVVAANETDSDSTPNNGTPPSVNEDDEATTGGGMGPDCTITASVSDVQCSDEGTITDPTDDTYRLKLLVQNPSNPNPSPGYEVTIVEMNLSFTGDYNAQQQLTDLPISLGQLTFVIKDFVTAGCEFTLPVDPPVPCSGGGNQPDLTLSNLEIINTPIVVGEILNYSFDIANNGNANANGNFNIKAWISTDNVLSADDVQDGMVTTGNFGPGLVQMNVPGASTIPNGLSDGSYFIILKVDADDEIMESNEGNNLLVAPFTIENSSACQVFIAESESTCDDNGTPNDATDDIYSLSLNVSGTNVGSSYNVVGGLSANNLPYGSLQPIAQITNFIPGQTILYEVVDISGNCSKVAGIGPLIGCSNGVGGIDLNLGMGANPADPAIYSTTAVTITVNNAGPETATNILVDFAKPDDVVYEGGNEWTATQGSFDPHGNQVWTVGSLAAGESASLAVNYFTLTDDLITPFAEVAAADGQDIDSTPGNGTCCDPAEDDEASVFINFSNGNPPVVLSVPELIGRPVQLKAVYPNPVYFGEIKVDIRSRLEGQFDLEIYDVLGRRAILQKIELKEGRNIIPLDVSNLESGTFYLNMPDQNWRFMPVRFVVARW